MITAAILASAISLTPYTIIDARQAPIGYKVINGNPLTCYMPSCISHYKIIVTARCKSDERREGFVSQMGENRQRGVVFEALAVMNWVALDAMFRQMNEYFTEACEWSA